MRYYADKNGKIIGRIYRTSDRYGEIGWYNPKGIFCTFFATYSSKFDTQKEARDRLRRAGAVKYVKDDNKEASDPIKDYCMSVSNSEPDLGDEQDK